MPNARAPGRGGGLPPLPELPLWAEPMGGGGDKAADVRDGPYGASRREGAGTALNLPDPAAVCCPPPAADRPPPPRPLTPARRQAHRPPPEKRGLCAPLGAGSGFSPPPPKRATRRHVIFCVYYRARSLSRITAGVGGSAMRWGCQGPGRQTPAAVGEGPWHRGGAACPRPSSLPS